MPAANKRICAIGADKQRLIEQQNKTLSLKTTFGYRRRGNE
jgi:hypothetical protein